MVCAAEECDMLSGVGWSSVGHTMQRSVTCVQCAESNSGSLSCVGGVCIEPVVFCCTHHKGDVRVG